MMDETDSVESTNRRSQILRVAAEIFATTGYDASTVRDIASAVGFSNSGSLYHHFESKDAILYELLQRFWATRWIEINAILSKHTAASEALRNLVEGTLQATIDFPHEISILNKDSAVLATLPEFSFLRENESKSGEAWRTLITSAIEEGSFRKETDVDLVYRTLMGAILWGGRWFDPRGHLQAEQVAEKIWRIVFYGVATTRQTELGQNH